MPEDDVYDARLGRVSEVIVAVNSSITDLDTRQAIERLASGGATQQDRDRVLYYLAITRWDREKLQEVIDARHTALCAECPLKNGKERTPIEWGGILKTALWAIAALAAALCALLRTGPSV